MRFDLKLG